MHMNILIIIIIVIIMIIINNIFILKKIISSAKIYSGSYNSIFFTYVDKNKISDINKKHFCYGKKTKHIYYYWNNVVIIIIVIAFLPLLPLSLSKLILSLSLLL